jgi:hypothetical protein
MQYEQLSLNAALVTAIVALTTAVGVLWKAYVEKSKQVETLLEAVTRTLAISEKAMERTVGLLARVEALFESKQS